ncbi:DUF5723 family protein [Mangrovimonas sp. ST2L15]|uniref:DUF5723 family protein n=1 Tax=Mangrovimonas sp. ST2L15 TaxID=1645916 RepID=UPI0006B5115F|nr:DUF5723 family protein [Mangrovimonas sp. ST2L15]
MKPHPISYYFICLVLLCTTGISAQSYIGATTDHYSGIHGVILNPAYIVNTPYRVDINLASASALGGSDYFAINVGDILKSNGGFDFDEDVDKFPKDDNNFFFNADVLGPSLMFNLNSKSSFGFSTRARGFLNLNNINGQLYENLEDGFDNSQDFNFNLENFVGKVNAWGEIGFTYARTLVKTDKNIFAGGITLKYLMGAGSAFFNTPTLSGQYDASSNTLTTNGSLSYGLSHPDFSPENIKFNHLTSGFGADLGLSYQWNEENADGINSDSYIPYKLKLGVSITDIGSINYKNGEVTQYDMNNIVDADIFDEDDFQQVLEDYYSGETTSRNIKIKLPTAFHLMADYHIKNNFYASINGDFSLISSKKHKVSHIINNFTLTPRFTTKWFSVYSPFSLREYGNFAWGFGLRAGPLMVGSGSVLSNLISNNSKSTDIYVGLKVPLYL